MKVKSKIISVAGILASCARNTFTFRELTTLDDLDQAFRFRYNEYSGGRMKSLLKHNETDIDIDIHDLHSRHYGLFSKKDGLIGYLRVVIDKREYYNQIAFETGRKFRIFTKREHSFLALQNTTEADYPFLSSPAICENTGSDSFALKSNNESLADVNRLIINEENKGLHTIALLIECAMVLYLMICIGHKHTNVNTCKDQRPNYQRYIFEAFAQNRYLSVLGLITDTQSFSLSSVPKSLFAGIRGMIKQYLKTGTIEKALN
jgi:hypothetical protein